MSPRVACTCLGLRRALALGCISVTYVPRGPSWLELASSPHQPLVPLAVRRETDGRPAKRILGERLHARAINLNQSRRATRAVERCEDEHPAVARRKVAVTRRLHGGYKGRMSVGRAGCGGGG